MSYDTFAQGPDHVVRYNGDYVVLEAYVDQFHDNLLDFMMAVDKAQDAARQEAIAYYVSKNGDEDEPTRDM